MYTDGLIERRGFNIDEGIDLLAEVVAAPDQPGPAEILARLTEAIGAPDDDVALSARGARAGSDALHARAACASPSRSRRCGSAYAPGSRAAGSSATRPRRSCSRRARRATTPSKHA